MPRNLIAHGRRPPAGWTTIVLLAVLGCGTLAACASAKDSAGCPTAFGSFRVGHWPPACWRPYASPAPSAPSPFNTPIPTGAKLDSSSRAIVDYTRAQHWTLPNGDTGHFVLSADGSRPVYWSQPGNPAVTVRCTGVGSYCEPSLFGPPPDFPRTIRVSIPQGARPQTATDGHMVVVDQEHGWEYDFWQARWTNGPKTALTVSAGGRIRIGADSGNGLHSYAEAGDLGLLGGLVRPQELAANRIDHALAVSVPCVQYHDVWPSPSSGTGDGVCANGPHLGSLLQLDVSDAVIAKAPLWERAIMRAMKRYGMYVVDTQGGGTTMYIVTEDDSSFTSFGYQGQMKRFIERRSKRARAASANPSLIGVPIGLSRLRVIDPCVPRRTC